MAEKTMSGMTDEEKFRFDLTGFLVRPGASAGVPLSSGGRRHATSPVAELAK